MLVSAQAAHRPPPPRGRCPGGGLHADAGQLVEHAATLGIDIEGTARKPGTKGFTPIPKRWTVERTYGWLMLHHRLARDYETCPAAPKP